MIFMHVLYSEMKLYSRSRYRVTNTSRYSSWVFSETPAQDLVALILSSNTWSEKNKRAGTSGVVSVSFVARQRGGIAKTSNAQLAHAPRWSTGASCRRRSGRCSWRPYQSADDAMRVPIWGGRRVDLGVPRRLERAREAV